MIKLNKLNDKEYCEFRARFIERSKLVAVKILAYKTNNVMFAYNMFFEIEGIAYNVIFNPYSNDYRIESNKKAPKMVVDNIPVLLVALSNHKE